MIKEYSNLNFSPDDYTAHICESNGWQYFWSVQQDIKGLIALTGGKDRFTEKLDSMFTYIPASNADLPLFQYRYDWSVCSW